MSEEVQEMIRSYIQRVSAETESLVAKFITEHGCKPSDVVLVERQTPTGRVIFPDLKSNHWPEALEGK